MIKCGFTILPTKFRELGHSISPRVRRLVAVTRIRFLVHTPSTLGLYIKRFSQNSSQLSGEIVRIHVQLGYDSSGHHLNRL
jgi:hypothetical protein